ncbi:MAG: hypothetical protein GWP14_00325 [Actinobacteria bacterium]|nr:hypothetical protein [Actinomycetota bacterium]
MSKSSTRTLFVDDADTESMRNLHRIIHPAKKYEGNPVVAAEQKWEGKELLLGGTVRKEGEIHRMWYQSNLNGTYLDLYAESNDGIGWTKPCLGKYEDFEGSLENNIYMSRMAFRSDKRSPASVKQDHNQNVLYTPHMGQGKTYTMLSYDYGRSGYGPYDGYYLAFSDDGVNWTDGPTEPVIPGYADVGWFIFDEKDQVFRGIVKSFINIRGYSRRSLLWTQSADGFNWTLPRPAFIPDLEDDRWAEGRAGCFTQYYGMPIERYESVILGFLQVFRCTNGHTSSDGTIDVQLTASRDGKNWQRVGDRRTIVERGEYGSWDWGLIEPGNALVVDGDQVRIYYTGYNSLHGQWTPDPQGKKLAIGMASWPRDRFVGMRAGSNGGELVVRSNNIGDELHINANAANGSLAVELADQTGRPIKGFEASECKLLCRDGLDHTVAWQSKPSTKPFKGKCIQIKLKLTSAEVFSLWWT